MSYELLVYPDSRIKNIAANVRFFDEVGAIIEKMKECMIENNLDALSAPQIGIQESVILLRDGGAFKEYINLRIISTEGKRLVKERTPYYGELEVEVQRDDRIKVIYENAQAQAQHLNTEGELSLKLQVQSDYTFGATFMDRVGPKGRAELEKKLEYGLIGGDGESCPTVFVRDYISRAINLLLSGTIIVLIISFFISDEALSKLLLNVNSVALLSVLTLIFGYFFYAQYEIRKFSTCTSCQTGNIFANSVVYSSGLIISAALTYFFMT